MTPETGIVNNALSHPIYLYNLSPLSNVPGLSAATSAAAVSTITNFRMTTCHH